MVILLDSRYLWISAKLPWVDASLHIAHSLTSNVRFTADLEVRSERSIIAYSRDRPKPGYPVMCLGVLQKIRTGEGREAQKNLCSILMARRDIVCRAFNDAEISDDEA